MDTDPSFFILEVGFEVELAEAEAEAAFSASVSIPFFFILRWKLLHTSSIRSSVSVRAIGVGSDILENFGFYEHFISKFGHGVRFGLVLCVDILENFGFYEHLISKVGHGVGFSLVLADYFLATLQ